MKSYDGIVVKVTEKQIVMLCTHDGTFKNIPRSKKQFPLIGEKITYKEKQPLFQPMSWMALASVACLLLLIFSLYPIKPAEAAYIVAIDINPSMEVYLDKNLKVTKVTTLNADGDRIITKIDYKDKNISDMVKLIIDQCVSQNYLTSAAKGTVTTTLIPTQNEHKLNETQLQSMIQDSLNRCSVTANVNVTSGSKETLDKAHQLKLSVNKYEIYEQLKQKGIPVSLETVQSTTITNLLEIDQSQNKTGQNNQGQSNQGKSNSGQNKSGQNNKGQNNKDQNNQGQLNPGQFNPDEINPGHMNQGQNNQGHNNQSQNNPGQSKK